MLLEHDLSSSVKDHEPPVICSTLYCFLGSLENVYLSAVDFPAPTSPMTANISPCCAAKATRSHTSSMQGLRNISSALTSWEKGSLLNPNHILMSTLPTVAAASFLISHPPS